MADGKERNRMNREGGRILVVDDDVVVQKALRRLLETRGYLVTTCGSGMEALRACKDEDFSVAFVDLKMPGMDGMELIRRLRGKKPGMSIVMITAYGEITTAVEAMKQGAYHFMTKPFDNDEVLELAASAVSQSRDSYASRGSQKRRMSAIVGDSPAMQTVYGLIERVAPTDSTVLITGESGTGKELVARAMHEGSSRASKPLVPVNCGSIPENLLESELFGHVKGAFTGALYSRPGRFSLADKGTIFLDEIGDMSPHLQTKLLRVIQEQAFEPVGSTKTLQVDVRVIAATHQNLRKLIEEKKFRMDLYYRLNVIQIQLPPLRERVEDIPLLCDHFLSIFNQRLRGNILGFDEDSMNYLCGYSWPGNVRELENLIERLVILKGEGTIGLDDIKGRYMDEGPDISPPTLSLPSEGICFRTAVSRFENELITQALQRTHGNKNKAADLLRLNRTTLVEKIKRRRLESEE
jgi:DNA-binding NtrC family response regulator